MAVTTIWHNPRCSKSRQTLALLHDLGIDPSIRLYLRDLPSEAEIRAALAALGGPATGLLRTGEALFKELGLTTDMDEVTLIAAMAAHPALIERPLVVNGTRARLGRPPEAVLDLF